jgi:hypothetical protein
MVDQKLIDYVTSAVNKGQSAEQIKTLLLKRGWPEGDIDDAIYVVTRSTKATAEPEAQKKGGHMKIYLIGLVVVLVIIGITGSYIFSVTGGIFPFAAGPSTEGQCGNGVCDAGETYETCPADCTQPTANPPPTGPTTVSVSPSNKAVANGETFTLDIAVADVSDLYGYQFNVEYDSTVLQLQSVGHGNFISRGGQDNVFCVDYNTQTAGLVKNIACTRMGRGSVEGSGILGSVTFKTIKSGASDIKITGVQLVSSKVEKITSSVSDGRVTVS